MQIHQMMVAEEEAKALRACRLEQKLRESSGKWSSDGPVGEVMGDNDTTRVQSLVALCPAVDVDCDDDRLNIKDDDEIVFAVVGTLDIHAARALPGEVLIGSCSNAAYLANVCTSPWARRRGVGAAMLEEARRIAREWKVEAMFVHTMAVNEVAIDFYSRHGFVIDKEETSNQAHYRGRCLDGIEGRGRTALLRDTLLHVASDDAHGDGGSR